MTAVVGALAKLLGVIIAPGMRGIASQRAMEFAEVVSATLGYTFATLLVALVCGSSFELARARNVGAVTRGGVVGLAGLIVALASPAVSQRLHTAAALALALMTSVVVLMAAASTVRVTRTRAIGAVLAMFALSGVLRPLVWQLSMVAGERASLGLYQASRGLSTVAVALQALATLLGAAWLGTRSPIRGRLLANAAIVLAFGLTYVAAREGVDTPWAALAVLRGALTQARVAPPPYGLVSIAAFLLPASILLALVAVVQRRVPSIVVGTLALALLSQGVFEVPLQALAVTAAAQWALLAMTDARARWSMLNAKVPAS